MLNTAVIGKVAASAITILASERGNDLSPAAVVKAKPEIEQAVGAAVSQAVANNRVAVVETTPAAADPINWTALGTATLTLVAAFGVTLTEEHKALVLTAVGVIGPLLIMAIRTLWSRTVTKASVEK